MSLKYEDPKVSINRKIKGAQVFQKFRSQLKILGARGGDVGSGGDMSQIS